MFRNHSDAKRSDSINPLNSPFSHRPSAIGLNQGARLAANQKSEASYKPAPLWKVLWKLPFLITLYAYTAHKRYIHPHVRIYGLENMPKNRKDSVLWAGTHVSKKGTDGVILAGEIGLLFGKVIRFVADADQIGAKASWLLKLSGGYPIKKNKEKNEKDKKMAEIVFDALMKPGSHVGLFPAGKPSGKIETNLKLFRKSNKGHTYTDRKHDTQVAHIARRAHDFLKTEGRSVWILPFTVEFQADDLGYASTIENFLEASYFYRKNGKANGKNPPFQVIIRIGKPINPGEYKVDLNNPDDPNNELLAELENRIRQLARFADQDTSGARLALKDLAKVRGVEVIKGGKVGEVASGDSDLLDVFDENGQINYELSPQSQDEVHKKGYWHKTAHVYVFDSQGRFLLQRRSLKSRHSPGKLQVSASGHVNTGESVLEAAIRETEEELGIKLAKERFRIVSDEDEIRRSYAMEDETQNNELTTAYVVRLLPDELPMVQANYNLGEVEDIWLLPLPVFEKAVRNDRHHEVFARTPHHILAPPMKAIYEKIKEQTSGVGLVENATKRSTDEENRITIRQQIKALREMAQRARISPDEFEKLYDNGRPTHEEASERVRQAIRQADLHRLDKERQTQIERLKKFAARWGIKEHEFLALYNEGLPSHQNAVQRVHGEISVRRKAEIERLAARWPRQDNAGARLTTNLDHLRTFFSGVAFAFPQAVNGARLSLNLDEKQSPYIFTLSRNGARLTAEANGIETIELEISKKGSNNQALSPKTLDSALTIQNLRAMTEAAARKVDADLEGVVASTEKTVIADIDLDLMDNPSFQFYLDYLIAELKRAQGSNYGHHVFFKVSGRDPLIQQALSHPEAKGLFLTEIPDDLKGAARVKINAANKGLNQGFINLPVNLLQEGEVPAFRALIKVAIYSGRIDVANIPQGFHDAYATLAGERPDMQTLKDILEGKADIQTTLRFAIKAITKAPIGQTIKFFKLMKKMIDQAA